jgi:hypothetical protein
MVHGMLLLQNRDAWCIASRFSSSSCCVRACVRACVAACVIDTIYELTRRRRPRRGGSNFRIATCESTGLKVAKFAQFSTTRCTDVSGVSRRVS